MKLTIRILLNCKSKKKKKSIIRIRKSDMVHFGSNSTENEKQVGGMRTNNCRSSQESTHRDLFVFEIKMKSVTFFSTSSKLKNDPVSIPLS